MAGLQGRHRPVSSDGARRRLVQRSPEIAFGIVEGIARHRIHHATPGFAQEPEGALRSQSGFVNTLPPMKAISRSGCGGSFCEP